MANRTCSVDGCDAAHSSRGYCAIHYQRWHRWGDPLGARPPRQETCSFPDCGKPHDSRGYCGSHAKQLRDGVELRPLRPMWNGAACSVNECTEPVIARGWCIKHYQRWSKYGDPLGTAPCPPAICLFPDCGKSHDSHGYCASHARQLRLGRELTPLGQRCTTCGKPAKRSGSSGQRKYALDEAYFDEITDERRAYWLGFITADGGITTDRAYVLRVELAERDQGHLLEMCSDLGSNRPLLFSRSCACASFGSRRLVESLERLGITPRKSATVQPWNGPEHLMPHYWRGLFDGDGSIYSVGKRSDWYINICGSKACVEQFAAWAREITGSRAVARQVRDTGCWAWAVGGGRKPQLLAEALYANATVALARKAERARQLLARDYDALQADRNLRRAAAMRIAWHVGTHGRSKAALT